MNSTPIALALLGAGPALLGQGCASPAPSPATAPAAAVAAPDEASPAIPRTTDPGDWRDEILYFAFTDRFANGDPANDVGAGRGPGEAADPSSPVGWHGGDFAGITQKINEGYFEKLGVTAIQISPVLLQIPAFVYADPGAAHPGAFLTGYHGYWAESLEAVDPHFGTLDELRALVEAAHSRNLKIVQDLVVNHVGYTAPLAKSHPDYFHSEKACEESSDKDKDCPLHLLPDFDQQKPEVVALLNELAASWAEKSGIDAYRLDAALHVDDSYWRQFFAAGGPGAKMWCVGEVFSPDPAVLAHYLDNLGLPSVLDFPLYFAIRDHLSSAEGKLDALADLFAKDSLYSDASRLTTFVDNHDVPRFMSEVIKRGASVEEARERLDVALTLLYSARGIPELYYGTEIAMQGKGDPYNFKTGSTNRDDMRFEDLARSSIDERLSALASARRRYPALTRGAQEELWRPKGGTPIFAFRRTLAGADEIVVVINNGDAPVALESLAGKGVSLSDTFAGNSCGSRKPCQPSFVDITGRSMKLQVDDAGRLVGTVRPRSAVVLASSGAE